MANIQTKLYIESVFSLTRSIVIKDPYAAEKINDFIMSLYPVHGIYVDLDRPDTWKYYLNLAGRYHALDKPMYIVSLDTLETILFDRDVLLRHRATFRAYSIGSRYYNELVAQYPLQETLIRGIVQPVDLDVAIKAKDFTILAHDKSLIEPQETTLLDQLQEWIWIFTKRWINADYRYVDELYATTIVNEIYAFIPNVVMSIRRENCLTYRAHTFHIWNYLESLGNLGQYRPFLNLRQTMWLYRNIRWVLNNAGKQDTHAELMRVLLTERGIPLGKYDIELDTSAITNGGVHLEGTVQRRALNLFEILPDEPVFKTFNYLIDKQQPLAKDNILSQETSLTAAKQLTRYSNVSRLPTKAYESEMLDLSLTNIFPLEDIIVNHWLYLAANNRYTANITVENPYTATPVAMTVKEAFVLWIYFYNVMNHFELTSIPKPQAFAVRRVPAPTYEELRAITEARHVSDMDIITALDDSIEIGQIISTETFYETCANIQQNQLRRREQWMVKEHYMARAQMEALATAFYHSPQCELVDQDITYLEWFNLKGWDFNTLSRYDVELFMTNILSAATGLNTQTVISLKDIHTAMLRLMAQLGTYATHYIQTLNAVDAVVPDIQYVRVGDLKDRANSTLWIPRIGSYVIKLSDRTTVRSDIAILDKSDFVNVINRCDEVVDIPVDIISNLVANHRSMVFGNVGQLDMEVVES